MAKEQIKKVIQKMVENGGKSVSKAMLEVGYSPAYAKNPQKLTNTKIYQDLISVYLPDEELIKKHRELLGANKIRRFLFPIIKKGEKKSELTNDEIREILESITGYRLIYVKTGRFGKIASYSVPDNHARLKALDLAYKLHGKYAPEQSGNIKRKYQDLTDTELDALIKTYKDRLKIGANPYSS